MRSLPFLPLAALMLCATSATAQPISFGEGWREQRFSLFSSNTFSFGESGLGVRSDKAVSLVWKPLPESLQTKRRAQWRWEVARSVGPTDLARKGGDDRNLALYFLFLPERPAGAPNMRALLKNPDIRVLMYVWGGAHARGQVLASPYLGARGRTLVLRAAGTGAFDEQVNLAQDFRRAFGQEATRLVGLAVSADSDDTRGAVRAQISDLRIE